MPLLRLFSPWTLPALLINLLRHFHQSHAAFQVCILFRCQALRQLLCIRSHLLRMNVQFLGAESHKKEMLVMGAEE